MAEIADSAENGAASTPSASAASLPSLPRAHQIKLLETAFNVASSIPVQPHIKTQSTAQAAVIDTALEINALDFAESNVQEIRNWRRGTAHADIATYWARNNQPKKAEAHLNAARQIAAAISDWHKYRIHSHMARALVVLGGDDRAAALLEDADPNEAATLQASRAETCAEDEYPAQLEAVKQSLGSERIDVIQQGLAAAVKLHNLFFDNADKRKEILAATSEIFPKIPAVLQIRTLSGMAENAIKHQDKSTAAGLLVKAYNAHETAAWQPRHGIPLLAELVPFAVRAGRPQLAKDWARKAEDTYTQNRADIVNIYRAETLVPLAAAYHEMAKVDKAETLYRKALDEAVINPNSRPRAVDLCMICRSLARHGVRPTDALQAKIKEVRSQLGAPW